MDWQRLARANTHPLRISILEVLSIDADRVLSPTDLSFELQAPLSNVNYHVTELAKSGMIELAGQRPVRGATENFYRLAKDGEPSTNGAKANGSHANGRPKRSKRTTGVEPATSSLGSLRSTN